MNQTGAMKRDLLLLYGIVAYLTAMVALAYCMAFFGNFAIGKTIDAAAVVPLGEALTVNILLLAAFAVQHSGMARKRFKDWLGHHVGKCHVRSTYVLITGITTIGVLTLWQPIGAVLWMVQNQFVARSIHVIYFAGWTIMMCATFLLDHFELLGLRQAWSGWNCGDNEEPRLRTPGLYRYVRHPIYLGWTMVLWATPVMTVSHLVFAGGMTIYMLIGIQFEERELVARLPEYEQYRRKVPMLVPSLRKRLHREHEGLETGIAEKTRCIPGDAGARRLRHGLPSGD